MTNHVPALREREALAVQRDHLAAMVMAQMAGRPATMAGQQAVERWNRRDIAAYHALTAQIDAMGEVVMGPGDWRRATVQTRLGGISEGVR